MIRKLGYIFTGLVLGVALLILFGSAIAGPKDCPPGQDGGCNTYRQKETGKLGCFPDNANPQGWIFVRSGCGQKEEKDPTATPEPVIAVPSPTLIGIFPTPTIKPGSKVTPIPTKWDKSDPKSTPTMVLLVESEDCTNSCLCLIVTQLAVGNDLQRTQIANDVQACSQP